MKQLAAIIFVLGLAMVLGVRIEPCTRPADATGTDAIMQRVFGESRLVLSKKFLEIADKYYHGGVYGVDCRHGITDHRQSDRLPGASHGSASDVAGHGLADVEDHHDHDHADDNDGLPQPVDWLSRLNRRVYPSGHRHLTGRRYEKEIIPWIWAATKADSQNVLAFNIGGFWLSERLNRPEEALQLLTEGIVHNPADAELELNRGRILLRYSNNAPAAAEALSLARKKWKEASAQWESGLARDDRDAEPDPVLYSRILVYSAETALKLGDEEQAANFYREAIGYSPNPDHIRHLLQQLPAPNSLP